MKPLAFSILFFALLITSNATFAQSSSNDTILYKAPVKYFEANPSRMEAESLLPFRVAKKGILLISQNYLTIKSAIRDSITLGSFQLGSIKKKTVHKSKHDTYVFLISKNYINSKSLLRSRMLFHFLINNQQYEQVEKYLK
jgi:hypothetical protein